MGVLRRPIPLLGRARCRAAPGECSAGRPRLARAAHACLPVVVALAVAVGLQASLAGAAGLNLVVNDTSDRLDSSPGDGACRTSVGTCTLRAAVQEANASPGADVVQVPSGTYELGIPPLNQNDIRTGDLDITDSLTVAGAGAGATIVDGGTPTAGAPSRVHGLDRLFEVLVDGGTVTFSSLTLSDGYAAEYGGAVMNNSTATVIVSASTLTGNVAEKTGGAIDNHLGGAVDVWDSTLSNNVAFESGSALNNNRGGTVTLTNSTISSNSAADVGLDETLVGAGAVANNAELDARGTITVTRSQLFENRSGGGRPGAAISNDGAGILVVDQATFSKNRSDGDGGAIFNGTGDVTVTDSTFTENAGTDGGAVGSKGGALTILDSSFSKNSAEDWGGGIMVGNQGGAMIRNSSFTENTGLNGGGVATEGSGLVTVESSTFTKNSAVDTAALSTGEGGGMHSNSGGEVVLTGGSFTENKAHAGGGFSNEGGGVVTITGTQFSANVSEAQGGGVLVEGGDVRMVEIDVARNVSESAEEGGGGISYAGDKSATVGESAAIENSRIRDNKSAGEGGGVDSRGDGPLVITTTAITGNTSALGGAIHHVGDATLVVTRSTLSGNFAENGGGVFTDGDGEATVENATVSGNRAGLFGGGLLVSSRLVVSNTTVANNVAASGGGVNNGGGDLIGDGSVFLRNAIVANNPAGGNCAGTITSLGGNVENSDSCQLRDLSDQPGTDPLLGPLAENGGPTQTHALLADSPAQDRAACTELDPCPSIDQRGVDRPKVAGFDIGAFESELLPGGDPPQCAGRTERPLSADFDSWVSQGSAGANFGSDGILKVESQSGSNERALVHFPLPAVPPGCKLVAATLRLYASAATDGRTLQAFRVTSEWSRTDVTWSNQPAAGGPAATTESGLGFREWDVLAQTRDMYTFGSHGFLIRDAVENATGAQSFHSGDKGSDRPPELVLVFDDPDAPPRTGVCPKTPQLLSADRDSWLSEGSPTNNFGTDSTLKVKSQVGSDSRALVRFPLPALPPGCTTISSAVLRLEASSAKDGRMLEALQAASAWSETGVTWRNQPHTTGPAAATPSAQGPLEWTVTEQVLGLYTLGNHGFMIRDAEEDGIGDEQTLSSREKLNDSAPELVFVFDDNTPETTIDSGPASPVDERDAVFRFFSDRDDATFECSLDGTAFRSCTSPHAIEGLAEGDHRLEVRATRRVRAVDPTPASHAWTVDVTEPETTIGDRPADPTNQTSASFAFSGSDNLDAPGQLRFQCRLDSSADSDWADCSSPRSYGPLAAGRHSFEVRAVDRAGNVGSAAGHAWTIDLEAPETTIDDRPADPSNSSSASFTLGGSDDLDERSQLRFQCRLDDPAADWAACESPKSYPDLGEGRHSFEVRAIDRAGNTDASPDSYSWTIDLTAPESSIKSGPDDPTQSSSASFTFSADEEGSVACSLDGGAFLPCNSPADYRDLEPGAHVFRVRATDLAGNVEPDPSSYGWTIDMTPPQTTISSSPRDPTNETSASFSFTGSDNVSAASALRYQCRLDSAAEAAWDPCASGESYGPLAAGPHRFEVRAIDGAGNVDDSPADHSWTIDVSAPESTIVGEKPADPTNSRSASLSFSGTDDLDAASQLAFQCRLDAPAFDWAPCESPRSYSELGEGRHSFEVRAIDRAGNVGSPVGYSWTVDVSAPETALGDRPPATSTSTSATFTFSSEAGASFECKLDAEAFAGCESPKEYTGLGAGGHRFEVRARDAAGNRDSSPAAHEWTVEAPATTPPDTTAPETTISSAPRDPTNETSAGFSFTGSDNVSAASALRYQCRLDSAAEAAWEPCASGKSYPGPLVAGAHRFEVQAIDAAGNVDDSPADHSWTIDVSAPESAIVGEKPADPTNSRSASLSFSGSDDLDAASQLSFQCRLDHPAADWARCESPKSYSELGESRHSFEVRAIDRAGNVGSPAGHGWTVDVTAPATTISSGPKDPSNETSAGFVFVGNDDVTGASALRFQCRLDSAAEAGWEACSSPRSYAGPLAPGSHTFEVRAIDAVGNVDDSPDSRSWRIDTSAPETEIGSGPVDPTNQTSASFAFSGTDNVSAPSALRFQCRLDSGDAAAWEACSSGKSYPGPLAAGRHRFEVRAIDAAGNVDDSPDDHSWTIDTNPPETAIGEGPPARTTSASATFTLSSEPGVTFECSLDGAPFAGCTSPRQYTGLAPGTHQFQVRGKDPAGNTDPSPASHSWTIDTTAPQTSIDSGPPSTTTNTNASFTFSANEAVTFECSLDEAAFATCESPREYTGLAVDGHQFRVRATDVAGNRDASPATWSWTIQAPAACAGPATVTAVAEADSWILQSSAMSNYGLDSVVKVDTKAGANARALFRFALPPIPAGCHVVDAKLRLYASSYKEGRTLQALQLTGSWTEWGVNWSNQPPTTGTSATVVSPSTSRYVEWSVTSQAQSMYSSGNHGLLIRDSVEGGNGLEQAFHSREKGTDNPPRLVISFG